VMSRHAPNHSTNPSSRRTAALQRPRTPSAALLRQGQGQGQRQGQRQAGASRRGWWAHVLDVFASWQLPVSERRVALMLGDMVASVIAVLIALRLWANRAQAPFTAHFITPRVYWFLVLPLFWLVLASANDYYNLRISANLWESAARLARVSLTMLALYLAAFFLAPRELLPRSFILYYWVLSLLLIGLWRLCRVFLIGWTGLRRRAVIVGAGRAAELIWEAIKEEAAGDYELLGLVTSVEDVAPADTRMTASMPWLGTASALPRLARELGIAEIILAYVNEVPGDVFENVMTCYERGSAIAPMPVLYEQITGRVPIEHVGDYLWALVLPLEQRTLQVLLYQLLRRVVDLLAGFIGLAVFGALCPALALAIKLDSPGPVFYSQRRVGRGGRRFTIHKLRSMVDGAEDESGARWADPHDPRVTRVGRFLRRTRLDELPQVWNVLCGEMSLIGPRPERPEFVSALAERIPFYRTRLVVTPGLTGWAQVRYRYGSSAEDALRKLQYDLYYIRHQSPMLDLLIALRTIGIILLMRGT
jgi:exopolysaccharide biosynthesis polyprenyl glycosylphosphotransferase